MLPNRVAEAVAPAFFLPFDQKYDVNTERSDREQVCNSACNGEDWALVVGDSAAVQVSISAVHMKRVRVPAFRWGRDDVVVTAGFVSVRSKVYSPDLPVEQYTGL